MAALADAGAETGTLTVRVPGGDVNQYLAVSALIAGGLYGIEQELELPEALEGNAYTSDKPRVPGSLREASQLFAESSNTPAPGSYDINLHTLHGMSAPDGTGVSTLDPDMGDRLTARIETATGLPATST